MSRADDLRAELALAELEEQYVQAKESGEHADLRDELRYARWVARGGPAEERERLDRHEQLKRERMRLVVENPEVAELVPPLPPPHTNRAVAEMFQRWTEEGK